VYYYLRTAELKKLILKMSGVQEFYGYDIHRNLTERSIKIGTGRLYAVLAEMKEEGLLDDYWEENSSGPRRRIYHISMKGEAEREKILIEAIKTVHDFYTEYLQSLPPERSAFEVIGDILTRNIPETSDVAYATSRISEPIRRVLTILRRKITQGNLFVIGERAKLSNSELENVSLLDGSFRDIPTKSGYLDLLIVTGNIEKECLDEYMAEWTRVLSETGTLTILTPTALVTTYQDPLTIGDFVEKFEQPRSGPKDTPDLPMLIEKMKEYFKKIETRTVVHITAIQGFEPRTKNK
jgi:DNA-binding PadR family transcriptional regulator